MGKVILCLCHDVTAADIERAVALGYDHPETIKRFTAALMGPCQGRSCGDAILAEIAAAHGTRSGHPRHADDPAARLPGEARGSSPAARPPDA